MITTSSTIDISQDVVVIENSIIQRFDTQITNESISKIVIPTIKTSNANFNNVLKRSFKSSKKDSNLKHNARHYCI